MESNKMDDDDTFNDWNPLHEAVINRQHLQLVHLLHRSDIDLGVTDNDGNTALHMVFIKDPFYANQSLIVKILKLLLNHGMNPNTANNQGKTVLNLAIHYRFRDVIDLLIQRGAHLNTQDSDGDSTAHFLIESEFDKFYDICWSKYYNPKQLQMVETESINFIRWLYSKGLNFNLRNNNGITPAYFAAQLGLQPILLEILKYTDNSTINYVNQKNRNILHSLLQSFRQTEYIGLKKLNEITAKHLPSHIINQHLFSIVKLLLEKGVFVNLIDHNGNTPLDLITKTNAYELIDLMMDNLPNVNYFDRGGNTLLHFILFHCRESFLEDKWYGFVKRLLSSGINVNLKNNNGYTPLQIVVSMHHKPLIEILQKHKANFKVWHDDGNLLHMLVGNNTDFLDKDNSRKLIDLMIFEGCKINVVNSQGATPLHLGLRFGNTWFVERLLELGANIFTREVHPYNFTTLHLAAHSRFEKYFINMFINSGVDINAEDTRGRSALHLAVGDYKTLDALLEQGAYADTYDYEGNLPLNIALQNENVESVKRLLEFGADINNLATVRELEYLIRNTEIRQEILLEWLKLKTAGLLAIDAFEDYVKMYIGSEKTNKRYFEREINELKSKMVVKNVKVSWYDFMHMNMNRRCSFMIANKVVLNNINISFPHYGGIIIGLQRQTLSRMPLLTPAFNAWNKLTNYCLPDICVEMIFSNLSNVNLRAVILSAE